MSEAAGEDAEPAEDDEEAGEEQQEGTEEAGTRGLFDPPRDSEYDDSVSWFRGLRQLPDAFAGPFSPVTRRLLRLPGSAFAVRFSGGDEGTGGFDPQLFTSLILRSARLHRWVSNSAFSGQAWLPGVAATLPGSLVAHFTRSPGETARRLGGETTFPSVYGARAVGRLLALSRDDERLLEAVQPLGKRAVSSYIATLGDAVEHDFAVDWLTREGQYAHVAPEEASQAIEALSIVPEMVEKRIPIVGRLDRPFEEKGTVRIQPIRGAALTLTYPPRLRESIRGAWGKYVAATMVVTEASNPSLPNAPRRTRRLRSIQHVYEDLASVPSDR